MSTDPKNCLMKEALTGQPSKESNFDATCEAHCNAQSKRQDQVHNWLHQIKNLVENEPAVFEDFEIIKKVVRYFLCFISNLTLFAMFF